MHTLYTYLEDNPGRRPEPFHELSHGEGFLEILRTRVNQPGFYLMDEPDAPLSFTACLGLVALLYDLTQAGSQAIVATHSPIVAAIPGASILELGAWASAQPDGRNCTSSVPGGSSSPTRTPTSATCSPAYLGHATRRIAMTTGAAPGGSG